MFQEKDAKRIFSNGKKESACAGSTVGGIVKRCATQRKEEKRVVHVWQHM